MGEKPGQTPAFHPQAGAAPDDIKKKVELKRDQILELGQKAKTDTDWRVRFRKSPLTYLGLAFGGGLLLSALVGGRRSSR